MADQAAPPHVTQLLIACLARYGHARLEAREGVAPSRVEGRPMTCAASWCRQARTDGKVPAGASLNRSSRSARCPGDRSMVRVQAATSDQNLMATIGRRLMGL